MFVHLHLIMKEVYMYIYIHIYIPIVSIVVPFWGLPYRILIIYLVKPKKGTTMETMGICVYAHIQ